MRNLWLLPLTLLLVSTGQNNAGPDGSPVEVLGSKYYKSRQVIERVDTSPPPPVAAVIQANKIIERNARAQTSPGMRDPNADTIDGRSAALEKAVHDARSPEPKPIDGYAYRAKIKNNGGKVIEVIFWEYQFKDQSDPTTLVRRQFLCGVNIKPDKDKELQAFSASGPSNVVNVEKLGNKPGKLFEEKVLINRVEYTDGTIWQRKDWNFAEIGLTYKRALATPWGAEMCRGL